MTPARVLATILALAAFLAGGAAQAQQWVAVVSSDAGLTEVDLSSVARRGDVAQTWMRETLKRPEKDQATGKMYSVVVTERYDDCANRKFAYHTGIRRNARGQLINSATIGGGWNTLAPGTVAEAVWRVACAATSEPAEEPLLNEPASGKWNLLGASADGKYHLYFAADRVLQVSDTHAVVFTRMDYVKPEFFGGVPIQHVLEGQILDCKNAKMGGFGSDYYMTPTIRAHASRLDPKSVSLENVAPGSFAFNHLGTICAAAVKVDRDNGADEAPKTYTGTAWAVPKGYLVTSYHVVEGAKTITVFKDGERMGEARVLEGDAANDLAVLKIEKWTGPPLTTLPLAARTAALGKSVFVLGYPAPGIMGQRVKMTAGEISSTSGIGDDARLLQMSVPIQGATAAGP